MRGKFFIVAPIIGLKSIIDLFGPLGLYSWQRAFINVVFIKHRSKQKLAEIGKKVDFRALFSEIYIKIEVFTSLELSYTSAPIAQLVACLTFFL